MRPLLICELGLHGDGDPAYYSHAIDGIVKRWTGWPPIAVKTQLWKHSGDWAQQIIRELGRVPLTPLSAQGLRFLKAYCHDRGLQFGCTAHDPQSVEVLRGVEPDFLKLGARADLATVDAAVISELPLVSSSPHTAQGRRMECVSAYPANAPWTGPTPGYSCHSVPGLAQQHVLQAAPHCWTIEVHVSARPKSVRPLPADMCVSLGVEEFMDLATEVGKVWKA